MKQYLTDNPSASWNADHHTKSVHECRIITLANRLEAALETARTALHKCSVHDPGCFVALTEAMAEIDPLLNAPWHTRPAENTE